MRSKFFYSLENDDVPSDVSTDDYVETKAEVDDASEEVASDTTEVEEMTTSVDDGVEASDTLVDLGSEVSKKVDDGEGLSESAARIAEITIESIRVRLGMPPSIGRMPSMESFKSPRSRVEATKIALEAGIVDTLKNIWKKIKEISTKIWEKIKMFLSNLSKNYDSLDKHINTLKSRASGLDSKLTGKEIENKSLAKAFSINGKANPDTIDKTFKNIGALFLAFKEMTSGVQPIMSTIDNGVSKQDSIKILDKISKGISSHLPNGKISDEAGETVHKFPDMPGGKTLVMNVGKSEPSFSIRFEDSADVAKVIKSADANEINSIIEHTQVLTMFGKEIRKKFELSEKLFKIASNTADKMIDVISKAADADTEKDKLENLKVASKVVSTFIKATSFFTSMVPGMHYSTCRNAAEYISVSISVLKKSEDKK